MQQPPHYLSRPEAQLGPGLRESFDQVFRERIRGGSGMLIDYALSAPKWQFLSYLGDTKEVLFHGSGNPDIARFEPRQSNDVVEFGNQRAVYASSDAIWASYFGILDRDGYVGSLVNSCFRVTGPNIKSGPHYYFSINSDALPHRPWRTATVYILSRQGFEQQPRKLSHGAEIESAQWRSFSPVTPLAKITVEPEEFPFLAQIHGHDQAVVQQRAQADPEGFPWLDD